MIEVDNVSLTLGGATVLSDITLRLPRGGVTALIGPNGAGKSSLLSLVARLRPLQTGRIRIDGLPVDTAPSDQLAKLIAILGQDTATTVRLRVAELVGFGRFPHSQGRMTADDRRAVRDALDMFDLTALADRFLDTLSGGQRQRAWVAMVFCQGADYILLDEPLNNLDMFHARKLMRTLKAAASEQGKTVVIVLHDINHAAAHADRIVAMKDGKVAAAGSTSDIITAAVLERVYGFPMDVVEIDGGRVVLHHR